MKRISLFVLCVAAVSISALAQAPDDATTKALTAAPILLRNAATVIKWKPDFTYDTLKTGTNTLVCYDRSGFPVQQAYSVECTSKDNLRPGRAESEGGGARRQGQVTGDARGRGKGWNPRETGIRIGVVPRIGSRRGPCSHTHDHRRAGGYDGVDRTAREWQSGYRVDYECGHVDGTPHDARRIKGLHSLKEQASGVNAALLPARLVAVLYCS